MIIVNIIIYICIVDIFLGLMDIVVIVFILLVFYGQWTSETTRRAITVVKACRADALATAMFVEPAVASSAHRPARVLASVERHAWRHVGDSAVRRWCYRVDEDLMVAVVMDLMVTLRI